MRQTKVTLVDDLDGETEAVETVLFGLDGQVYEIDLAKPDELRGKLAKYVAAARKMPRGGRVAQARQTRVDLTGIREWAKSNGYRVNERGRIPANVVAGYEAARTERHADTVPPVVLVAP